MARLSEAQRTLLLTALGRADGSILPLPLKLAIPASAPRAIRQLVRRGLAEERHVRAKALVWRADDGSRLGVFITAAGTQAVRVSKRAAGEIADDAPVELEMLARLSEPCLRSLWSDMYQAPATKLERATLVFGIAHRMQHIAVEKMAKRHALELACLLQAFDAMGAAPGCGDHDDE